jgi:two-component system OmpR family response regulator
VTKQTKTAYVVSDDEQLRGLIVDYLRTVGLLTVDSDADAALDATLQESAFDIVILDLQVSDGDGLSICRRIRAASAAPLLVVTPRGEPTELTPGQELMADDYLRKPFSTEALIARVRRLSSSRSPYGTTKLGHLRFSPRGRQLIAEDGTVVMLSNAEFNLLSALVDASGAAVPRERLAAVIGDAHDNGVEAQIASLREKLVAAQANADLICEVGNHGYMIDFGAAE